MLEKKEPVFNKPLLLERLMNDEELARNLAGVFLGDVPERIKKLKDCLAKNDAKGVERAAHSIKGAASNMGGDALAALASSLENAASSQDLSFIVPKINELDSEFQALKKEMEKFTG